jgi:hypothetical protein
MMQTGPQTAQAAQPEQPSPRSRRAESKIVMLKDRAYGVFPGTPEQFEELWPEILKRWQIEQTLAALAAHDRSSRRAL